MTACRRAARTIRGAGCPTSTLAGATLHYAVSGAGEPILLIPGLGFDHTYYRFGIPLLAQHLQVLAVDPRGIGALDQVAAALQVEGWADDFAAMIDRLGFGPIHVLGSSLGGSMALALAQRHPGKLKSLMVVGGFSELDRATELNFRLRLRLIEKLGMSDEVADYMGLWTLTRKFINSDAGYATMRANQDEHPHQLGGKLQRLRGSAAEMGPLPAGTGAGAKVHHIARLDQGADAGGDVRQRSPDPAGIERPDCRAHCRRQARRDARRRPHSRSWSSRPKSCASSSNFSTDWTNDPSASVGT